MRGLRDALTALACHLGLTHPEPTTSWTSVGSWTAGLDLPGTPWNVDRALGNRSPHCSVLLAVASGLLVPWPRLPRAPSARGHTDLTVLLLPSRICRNLSARARLVALSWGLYILGLVMKQSVTL